MEADLQRRVGYASTMVPASASHGCWRGGVAAAERGKGGLGLTARGALAGAGAAGDLRERQKSAQPRARGHPNRALHLHNGRQAGGGAWQRSGPHHQLRSPQAVRQGCHRS